MRRLGQHFLTDKNALEKISRLILSKPSADIIIEIGPGHGELTEKLVAGACAKKIVVIERDPSLADFLEKKFEGGGVDVLSGDALKILPDVVGRAGKPYVLAGNIPYYITGKLFRIIGELERKPVSSVFLIQKEVAERMTAKEGSMNRLSASIQFWGEPSINFYLGREAFSPPPKVSSAVIEITTKNDSLPAISEDYYRAVGILFSQPRKTILNSARDGIQRLNMNISDEEMKVALAGAGIKAENRPSDLTLTEISKISAFFKSYPQSAS